MKTTLLTCVLAAFAGVTLAADKPMAELLKDAGVTAKAGIGCGFAGSTRYSFQFEGMNAYFDEPANAKPGKKWMWCMKWPGAFSDLTGQEDGVKRGYYYVYLDDIKWMNPEGTKIAKRFHDLLVEKLGFAPKAFLIGMSWGGFYSTRYAATYPGDVAKIYLDAPVMNFGSFNHKGWGPAFAAWPKPEGGDDWAKDPRMPINLAEPIAKAKIPILLLYGGADTVVVPSGNCEIFIPRFKAAGGDIRVEKRGMFAHHPHGFCGASGEHAVVDFFEK